MLSARAWLWTHLACASCVLASGCEFASEAVVLTRMLPSATAPRDAATDDVQAADRAVDGDVESAADATADAKPTDAGALDQGAAADNPSVLPGRLLLLDRGIEVSQWMGTQYTPNWYSAAELARLKLAGFRNLRIAFGVPLVLNDSAPGTLRPAGLANLDDILDQVLAAGLAVIIHPAWPASTTPRNWNDPAYAARMTSFWSSFALHLVTRNRDPGRVFLKVENDPDDAAADSWYAAQAALVKAVREVDPDRTILLTPNSLTRSMEHNTITAVTEIPVGPSNVVYDFGFFAPITFTHQSATWRVDEPWMALIHDLPYPSSPTACASVLSGIMTTNMARAQAQIYCDAEYDRPTIEGLMAPAVAWAKSKKVALTNGAFGVYKPRAPAAGRAQWLSDVRAVFEANGIPWTYYDDSAGFSLMTGMAGQRTVEPGVAQALNLSAP